MAGTVTLHTDQLTLTTPTVSLYPDGSDTAAETGTSATEATNRKGTYTFSNATATGLHLIILISSATQRWYGWAVLATSGNIVAYDSRDEAIRMQATASTGVQDVVLTSTGLDNIPTTAPTGVAANFREMMVQIWRRMFKKSTLRNDTNELETYADDGTTVLTTQAVSDNGTTQEIGAAT